MDRNDNSGPSAEPKPSQIAGVPVADPSSRVHRSRPRRWIIRTGAVVAGLLFGLLLAEIMVRGLGIGPPRLLSKRVLKEASRPAEFYHCYPSNPHGEFEPLPDLTQGDWQLSKYTFTPVSLPVERAIETPWCVKYVYSSQLIRDREYPAEPPEGVVRIACIGDSFVFGEGVPEPRTLPRQLEALLETGYEVMNAGVVGFSTDEEVDTLRKISAEAQCRRAVFVFIPNDIRLTPQLSRRQKYIHDLILIRDHRLEAYESRAWYTGHLRALQLVGGNWAMANIKQDTIQWYLDSYDPRHNRRNLEALAASFRALADLPDCRSAFVLYPLMEGFEGAYPLTPVHTTVGQLAREAGLPVLDLAPYFDGMQSSMLWVHPTDHHPNGNAHAIAARAIFDWLRDEVPGFLTSDTDRPAGTGVDVSTSGGDPDSRSNDAIP